jgi:hypothetical protein
MNNGCEASLMSAPVDRWTVDQVIVFDWQDGPDEGIGRLADPLCHFYFRLLDRRRRSDGLDDRLFRIEDISAATFQSCVDLVQELGAIRSPVWIPLWPRAKAALADQVDQILQEKHQVDVVIRTTDMEHFYGVYIGDAVATLLRAYDRGERFDWFERLGISLPLV